MSTSTKKINWQWWRDSENRVTAAIMPWVDALVFALVAVYFINIYFFQNYVIPSSSLEKSLLVGDYLFVSKVSYGPRKPQTPPHAAADAAHAARCRLRLVHRVAAVGLRAR